MVSIHANRMFALYQSSLPKDIIDIINKTIKDDASSVIANYWWSKNKELKNAFDEYYRQTKYYTITQQDINLIYTLKRSMKNKCIQLDYTFWHKVLERMYERFYVSKTVIIGDCTFNQETDGEIIVYFGNLLLDLLMLTDKQSKLN